MSDPLAFRASKRAESREIKTLVSAEKKSHPGESDYRIRERVRKTLDTGYVATDQPLQPYTGKDHSSRSVANAVSFWFEHNHPDWHKDGSCRAYPQEMFYGSEDREGKTRHHPNLTVDEVAKARRVCNSCPVQMECLDFAISNREEFGIWGGSTAGQRRRWIKDYEERHLVLVDDSEIDLTSYDEVYGGYDDDQEDLEDVG